MFYKTTVKDHIRVTPELFDLELDSAITKQVKKKFEGQILKDMGIIVGVGEIKDIQDGIIVPGDGSPFYEVVFELYNFKPEMQEVVFGKVKDLADFGAFLSIGPIEGMVHVSQTMDDFVSFSKDKVLLGKESKRTLKVGDKCKARIIAVSFKDLSNPKLGLTMRQEGLGKLEWYAEDKAKKGAAAKTPAKKTKAKDKK